MDMEDSRFIAVKGAGDLATGVIHRLSRAGFRVLATELPEPTVVRRTVAFAEAVTTGTMTVEGITAQLATTVEAIPTLFAQELVPILLDADGTLLHKLQPAVLVEATVSKHNSGITLHDAPIVIALGPGYEAGKDAHAVIETNRGHNLGRVYLSGSAEANTGRPGAIGGYTIERLLRSPCTGSISSIRQIGDMVQVGETVAMVKTEGTGDEVPVVALISGILRGLIRDGLHVHEGMKVGDIDPRAAREHCFTISDKARAVAGGVLEAMLYLFHRKHLSLC